MYKTCPKCGYTSPVFDPTEDNCPKCGLVFSKWMKKQYRITRTTTGPDKSEQHGAGRFYSGLLTQVLYVGNLTGQGRFYGYVLIYLIFFFWGWSFIFSDLKSPEMNQSFMHYINLVFHEAGHILFRPFGEILTILGGSLMQLLVPVVAMGAFIFKHRDNFAASICLWWLAQSMMDLVPYIHDARAQELWLLGGVKGKDIPGIHDWHNILSRLDLLNYDHVLASVTAVLAIGLMLVSFAWGAYLLYAMYEIRAGDKV